MRSDSTALADSNTSSVYVLRVPMASSRDVSALTDLLGSGRISAEDVRAVIGKTEGTGGRNDLTKSVAAYEIQAALTRLGTVADSPYFAMSGGCEGVLSPHVTCLIRANEPTGLLLGTARGPQFDLSAIGSVDQVVHVAELVASAARNAGVGSRQNIHFVQVNCPAPFTGTHSSALASAELAACSRGAAALGVGVALGELDGADISERVIRGDWSVFSSVASASSEFGTRTHEVLVLASSAGRRYRIDHTIMRDALDSASVRDLAEALGIATPGARLAAAFVKCEPDARGTVRGWRHTMLTDEEIPPFRHSRAAVGAVIASTMGDTALYVSAGAEHQGPFGGGTISLVVEHTAD